MITKLVTLENEKVSIKLNDGLQLKKINNTQSNEKIFSQAGIWIDGHFSWFHDEEWESRTYMHSHSNVVYTVLQNKIQSICIQLEETIDPVKPVFYRKLTVINQNRSNKNIRLYFFQNVSEKSGGADTVFFAPKERVMLHYQKNKCWLFNGDFGNSGIQQYTTFSQVSPYTIDKCSLNEKSGGLFLNPIAKGNVTSVFSLESDFLPYESKAGFYWFINGQTKDELMELNNEIVEIGPKKIIRNLILGRDCELPISNEDTSEEKVILIR